MPVTWVRVSAAWGQEMYSVTTGTCLPAYLAGSANATAAHKHHGSVSVSALVAMRRPCITPCNTY